MSLFDSFSCAQAPARLSADHVADIPRLLETIRVLHDHFIIFRRGTHLQTLALAHRAALLQRQLLPAHVCDIRFSPTSKYVAFAAETLLSFAAETLLSFAAETLLSFAAETLLSFAAETLL